jgi:hypothetical protein
VGKVRSGDLQVVANVFSFNAWWTLRWLLRLLRRLPIITDFTHYGDGNRFRSVGFGSMLNDPSSASHENLSGSRLRPSR